MSGTDNVLLVIGSGLKMYREYLVRPASAYARSLGLKLVLVNNLRPTWQTEYFDEIQVANAFDHTLLFDTAERSPGAGSSPASVLGRALGHARRAAR